MSNRKCSLAGLRLSWANVDDPSTNGRVEFAKDEGSAELSLCAEDVVINSITIFEQIVPDWP